MISPKSVKPIYDQIFTQIKKAILSGELQEGDPLPAMRPLAKSLKVSVITVQKAYENLQRAGFVDSAVGKGTFVAEHDAEGIMNEQIKSIELQIDEITRSAKNSGISYETLKTILQNSYYEEG